MRHKSTVLAVFALVLSMIQGSSSMALTNSVTVESTIIPAGATDTVGIYLENNTSLRAVSIPLVIRAVTPGSYMTSVTKINGVPGSRIAAAMHEIQVSSEHPSEDGNCKGGQPGGFSTVLGDTVDFVSPDAITFTRQKIFSSSLGAGTDYPVETGVPSFALVLTASSVVGAFEIDTTCIDATNHLLFISDASVPIIPSFVKGTICIEAACVGNPSPLVLNPEIGAPDDQLHITSHTPLITWQYHQDNGDPQAAYEVQVGTDDDWTVAEMWSLPRFEGSDTAVVYAGAALVDGQSYFMRVRVESPTAQSEWTILQFRMNNLPSKPVTVAPVQGEVVAQNQPLFAVTNASDSEGDPLLYDFEVYTDPSLTQVAASVSGVSEGETITEWISSPLAAENALHWWHCRANDGYEFGPWSDTRQFWLDSINDPPEVPALVGPPDNSSSSDPRPVFEWEEAFDPDPGAVLTYDVILGTDSIFADNTRLSSIESLSVLWPTDLDSRPYWWKVEADDGRGGVSTSDVWSLVVSPSCQCPLPADLNADNAVDAVDVSIIIDVIFFSGPDTQDPLCPATRADFNADGFADAVDLSGVIDYVFFGGVAPIDPCLP